MPPQVEERDERLEKATEFANRQMDKAGVPPAEEAEPKERARPEPAVDFGAQVDRITHPAHERFVKDSRDRKMERALAEMEKKLLERVETLAPKPEKPPAPRFEDDPVGWQEHRDREFEERLVDKIAERVSPPGDPDQEAYKAEVTRRQRELDEVTIDYVSSSWQGQGYGSPQEAFQGMRQRALAYQDLRAQEIAHERGVDLQTAIRWRDQEIARDYQWAAENGKHPIAYLDSLAMRKIQQYAGSGNGNGNGASKEKVSEDAKERRDAAASGMAGGISTSSAPRNGEGPLKRMKLSEVPKDRNGYRLFVQKNRQDGETWKEANQRIQAHFRQQA